MEEEAEEEVEVVAVADKEHEGGLDHTASSEQKQQDQQVFDDAAKVTDIQVGKCKSTNTGAAHASKVIRDLWC